MKKMVHSIVVIVDSTEKIFVDPDLSVLENDSSYHLHNACYDSSSLHCHYNEYNDDYNGADDIVDHDSPLYYYKYNNNYFWNHLKRPHLTLLFSVFQCILLLILMLQCTTAPLNINPTVGPPPEALYTWGAKNTYSILHQGQYWRLVMPIFLHAGILHLACNLYIQMTIGANLECLWTSRTWCMLYIGSGIQSSIWSCCFQPNSLSVGCSGSLMGLLGAHMVETMCHRREEKRRPKLPLQPKIQLPSMQEIQQQQQQQQRPKQASLSLRSTCRLIMIILLFSFVPHVDWAAHLGGLVGGLGMGLWIWCEEWLLLVGTETENNKTKEEEQYKSEEQQYKKEPQQEHDLHEDVTTRTTPTTNTTSTLPSSSTTILPSNLLKWRMVVGILHVFVYGILFYYMTHVIQHRDDLMENVCDYYQQQYDNYQCHCPE